MKKICFRRKNFYRGRISFAGGNRRRSGAISAGKSFTTAVHLSNDTLISVTTFWYRAKEVLNININLQDYATLAMIVQLRENSWSA